MKRWLVLLLVAACAACSDPKPETLVEGGYDEAEMAAAIARAQTEVDSFIATLSNGNGSDFAVKVPIDDKGETEHFWLTDITYRDGEFEGRIGNDPGVVTNVRFGQTVKVRKDKISDWLFMRDGKMHGNYTLRPLLATMSEEEAARYRSMLAEP
jgi:uncharacterized protein YegJ (DUF2314 family)